MQIKAQAVCGQYASRIDIDSSRGGSWCGGGLFRQALPSKRARRNGNGVAVVLGIGLESGDKKRSS